MPSTKHSDDPVTVIAHGLLSRCSGSFGPDSPREAGIANDYDKDEYIAPATRQSCCMDDRNKRLAIGLPGNRAISEIASDLMDSSQEPKPLSTAIGHKVDELIGNDRVPVFHGDKAKGKNGCAANLYLRVALAANAKTRGQSVAMAYDRLRLLGIDSLSEDDLKAMIDTGTERAADDRIWDTDAAGVIDTAIEHGAPVDYYEDEHRTAGPREDMSRSIFNNQAFRSDHQTDDGQPMGALSITYGAYMDQLREDGFSNEEIANKVAGVVLFSVAMLKLACKDEAVDVIVGNGMID